MLNHFRDLAPQPRGIEERSRTGGIRTHTGVTPADFKSAASAVPPPSLLAYNMLCPQTVHILHIVSNGESENWKIRCALTAPICAPACSFGGQKAKPTGKYPDGRWRHTILLVSCPDVYPSVRSDGRQVLLVPAVLAVRCRIPLSIMVSTASQHSVTSIIMIL